MLETDQERVVGHRYHPQATKMSPGPATPRTPVYRRVDDDRDMLESLKGLSIKGFFDESGSFSSAGRLDRTYHRRRDESPHHDVSTPTSTNPSLSTPPALRSSRVFLVSPSYSAEDSLWVSSSVSWASTDCPLNSVDHDWYSDELKYPIPNAPMMKDLDSFTDGTGPGSFDFPMSAGGDDVLPLIFHPPTHYDEIETTTPTAEHIPNSLALDLLPLPSDLNDTVRAWREGVSATSALLPSPISSDFSSITPTPPSPPPKKRRRSLTLDSDRLSMERRTRAWSPTFGQLDFPRLGHTGDMSCSTGRPEPAAPG